MRRLATALGLLALIFWAYGHPSSPALAVDACPGQAATLIQLVNNLRARLGLPAYQTHPIVMSVAQAHSEYQAGIDKLTHIGPGGSHPADRLKAAGYGNGGRVLASENIAWGYHMGPQGAIDLWLPSAIHYYTMTIPQVRHVGAGCATSRTGKTYYTLLVAWAPGVGLPPPRGQPPPPTGGGPPQPTPTPTLSYVPVLPATPRPDGAVIHEVQPGQTLMMIALSYRVPLEQILELNHLTRTSFIYPGQKLIIVPPRSTPTATPTPRATASPTRPRPAPSPSAVTPSPEAAPSPSPFPSPTVFAPAPDPNVPPALGLFLGLLLWLGLAGLGWLVFARRAG